MNLLPSDPPPRNLSEHYLRVPAILMAALGWTLYFPAIMIHDLFQIGGEPARWLFAWTLALSCPVGLFALGTSDRLYARTGNRRWQWLNPVVAGCWLLVAIVSGYFAGVRWGE